MDKSTIKKIISILSYGFKKVEIIDGLEGIVDQEVDQDKLDARRLAERVVSEITDEDGSLKAKVFNKENEFRYIGDELGYTQGVGLSYDVDFNTFKDMIQLTKY